MLNAPVFGSYTTPCTKALWLSFASLQGPLAAFVADNWYGVASPCADNGLAGTTSVQSMLSAAACEYRRGIMKIPAPTSTNPTVTSAPISMNGEKCLCLLGPGPKGLCCILRMRYSLLYICHM